MTDRYPRGQHLRHHGGSVWKVIRYAEGGDYRIRCVAGTVREGFIGGEVEGSIAQVHRDYLHGGGWTLCAAPDEKGAKVARS